MKIYLAGKVPKGEEIDNIVDWRVEYAKVLNSIPNSTILSPEDPSLDEAESLLVFGHDCFLVKQADAVLVNATMKLGVGTSQEMLIAKYFNKPVVTVLPKDTHHRRTNLHMHAGVVADWIHPFLFSTSDIVVENVDLAAAWLKGYVSNPLGQQIKGIEIIDLAISQYMKTHK